MPPTPASGPQDSDKTTAAASPQTTSPKTPSGPQDLGKSQPPPQGGKDTGSNTNTGSSTLPPSSSTTTEDKLKPEQLEAIKRAELQSDKVLTEVLQHLDWDLQHPRPPQKFSPYHFFCPTALYDKKPEFQALVRALPKTPATRKVKSGTEQGFVWKLDEKVAASLEAGVEKERPRMYLGVDLVLFDGKLQRARVVGPF